MSDLDDLLQDDDQTKTEDMEAGQADAEPDEGEAEGAEQSQDESDEPERGAEKERETVPLAAFLETQRKLQARLDEAEKKARELEAAQKAKPDLSAFYREAPKDIPSPFEDDEGYTRALEDRYKADMANRTFGISLDNAVTTFGEDKVNTALQAFGEAARSNPLLMQAAEASVNPVREIVNWYDQQSFLRQRDSFEPVLSAGGLDAYKAALRAEWEAERAANAAQTDENALEQSPQEKQKLPGNFNKGGKGGVGKFTPASLDDLLG